MNSSKNLLKRLLRLYPVKNIKESFKVTGHIDDVIEQVATRVGDIQKFAFESHSFTKQHIYLYLLDKNFTVPPNFDDFPFKIQFQAVNNNGETVIFCLPISKFSVYLSDPIDKVDLHFYQPVIIRVKNKNLVIQYTKLEKNVSFYFPPNRDAKKAGEKNSEEETLQKILSYFKSTYAVSINDINKGVKHLWHTDHLDCYRLSWQNPFSSVEEKMNGDLTFKQKYPEQYEKIRHTPIGKAVWKYLQKDDYLCDVFAGDLSLGKLSVTTFPKNSHQVSNVITKILTNNK